MRRIICLRRHLSSVMSVEFFFFYCYGDHRDLHVLTHSFPTRRSSDLRAASLLLLRDGHDGGGDRPALRRRGDLLERGGALQHRPLAPGAVGEARREGRRRHPARVLHHHRDRRHRSEEHTSELQSLMRISYAVFCLKKKTDHVYIQTPHYHTPITNT